MKKTIIMVTSLMFMSASVFAECNLEEGDDYSANGKYLWADSCKVYVTAEAVNKKCSKAKIRVGKITGAFGMRINNTGRFNGVEAGAGDLVWVSIN